MCLAYHDEERPRAGLEELEAAGVALHGEGAVRRRGDASRGAALAYVGHLHACTQQKLSIKAATREQGYLVCC